MVKVLTALQVPQPHTVHAALWVLSGHVQGCTLALTTVDVGAGNHASVGELQVTTFLASRSGILPRAASLPGGLPRSIDAVLPQIY